MKHLFIVYIYFATHSLFCQNDPAGKKTGAISVEFGYSTSMFMENHSGKRFNTNDLKLSYFKCAYSKGKFSGLFDCKIYSESNPVKYSRQNPQPVKPGYIYSRYYIVMDIGLAYRYQIKKLKLYIEPSVLFSARPWGDECVYPNYFPTEPHIIVYRYKSLGFGAGVNFMKSIYKNLYIALEMQYNHFFESNKSIHLRGYEDFDADYKVNKNMITPSIRLGYQIQFRKR